MTLLRVHLCLRFVQVYIECCCLYAYFGFAVFLLSRLASLVSVSLPFLCLECKLDTVVVFHSTFTLCCGNHRAHVMERDSGGKTKGGSVATLRNRNAFTTPVYGSIFYPPLTTCRPCLNNYNNIVNVRDGTYHEVIGTRRRVWVALRQAPPEQ